MRRVTASEAAGLCEGRLYGADVDLSRRWQSDSRDGGPGDAFVAIKGAKTDGHIFLNQVVKGGAKLLLVSLAEIDNIPINSPEYEGVSVIAVPDTTVGMSRIAQMYLQAVSPQVVAITGSVGKTTTRELAVSALGSVYKIHSAVKSYNTVIGCSLTILSMPYDTEILILELGTNHFGEIAEMVSLFPPETAVITEVAPAHLEGFGDIDGVLKAKLEICRSLKLKQIIYNGDNALLRERMLNGYQEIKKISVGHNSDDTLKIADISIVLEDSGAAVSVSYLFKDEEITCNVPLFGLQHSYNIGYAVALGRLFNVDKSLLKNALAKSHPISGRGVCRRALNGSWVIDESYNANPNSMNAAIMNVLNINKNNSYRLVAVLGGMRELGETAALWHQKIIDKTKCFDTVVFLGEEWYDSKLAVPENMLRYKTYSEALQKLRETDISRAIVLVKGSNSYGLNRLVRELTEGIYDC